MDNSFGLINLLTAVTLLTTTSMVMVDTVGQMAVSTVVTGCATRCTELVSLPGLTEESMTDSTSMIKSRVTVCSPGQMVDNMMAHG